MLPNVRLTGSTGDQATSHHSLRAQKRFLNNVIFHTKPQEMTGDHQSGKWVKAERTSRVGSLSRRLVCAERGWAVQFRQQDGGGSGHFLEPLLSAPAHSHPTPWSCLCELRTLSTLDPWKQAKHHLSIQAVTTAPETPGVSVAQGIWVPCDLASLRVSDPWSVK